MPAVVTPPVPTAAAQRENSQRIGKGQTRKTRIVRRRGRAPGGLESDDEIEREAGSDESDESDSLASESDASESEPDDGAGGARAVTPSTTQSPPPPDADELKARDAPQAASADGPFQHGAANWSDMVADEDANGAGELPVIDFADLGAHPVGVSKPKVSRPAVKSKSKAPHGKPAPDHAAAAPPTVPVEEDGAGAPGPSAPPAESTGADAGDGADGGARRLPGQSARQAYQQRLEKDPSYVPVIGEFWGHDDRLLDKSVRSMSGWWQGRWQGRGRGRGGFEMRGRGRGGYFGGPSQPAHGAPDAEAEPVEQEDEEVVEVPPIERAWTHDGFEEMKRKDEQRRQQQAGPPQRGGFGPIRGGRGAFAPRGRGALLRGGFVPNAPRPMAAAFSGGAATSEDANAPTRSAPAPSEPRIWYAMKPERTWTKQHEAFLYLDPAMKPRPGVGSGYRVRMPGGDGDVVRGPPRQYRSHTTVTAHASSSTSAGANTLKAVFTVRLPGKGKGKASSPIVQNIVAEESITTAEPPIMDELPARPISVASSVTRPVVSSPHVVLPDTSTRTLPPTLAPDVPPFAPPTQTQPPPAHAFPRQVMEQNQLGIEIMPQLAHAPMPEPAALDDSANASTDPIVAPQADVQQTRPAPPPLSIPTFAPAPQLPPQPSPPYGSPYGYPPTLPPGIAISQHGMPYEVATGRPVFLPVSGPPPPAQQPPPGMYTPPPVMHHVPHPGAVPFVPGHMHHPSVTSPGHMHPIPHHAHQHSHHGSVGSPDFLAPHARPPALANIVEYSTGRAIFTPPRQSSRIEIRAPSEDVGRAGGVPPKATSPAQPSGLRTGFVPPSNISAAAAHTEPNGHHPGAAPPQVGEPMVMYAPYGQQQYYYPEHYTYQPYVDMSQMQQYEMYQPQEHVQQQVVYY